VSEPCPYCGTNPYVGCKHRSPIERPVRLAEPIPDKVDMRKFQTGQGRAFAVHRAKVRKQKAASRTSSGGNIPEVGV
jgi:hypothetical protein